MFSWLPRYNAERSKDWIQPIPCAVIRNHSRSYCILRRVRKTRRDLRARISLIVGGHVDRASYDRERILSLFSKTIRQELDEELGVQEVSHIIPRGLIIDSSSLSASRHIAFVYETVISRHLTARAPEEFSSRSKFTGHFFTPVELQRFHKSFDPWSLVLFEDYIAPSCSLKIAPQLKLRVRSDE